MSTLVFEPPAILGPAAGGSTDNAIVRWDGATGRLVQNSALVITDTTGDISGFASGAGLTLHGGGTIAGANGNVSIGASSKVLLGTVTDSANGRLQLADHTTSADGIGFGTDTSLHRQAPGALQIKGLTGEGSLHFGNTTGNSIGSISTSGSNLLVTVNNQPIMTLGSSVNVTFGGVVGVATGTDPTTALNMPAATTGRASARLPHGVAPTTPVNGDLWTTTAGLFVRINGVTVGPLS